MRNRVWLSGFLFLVSLLFLFQHPPNVLAEMSQDSAASAVVPENTMSETPAGVATATAPATAALEPADSADASTEPMQVSELLFFVEIPQVSSAGFFKMSALKAPSYSQVLSISELADSAVLSLADILQYHIMGVALGNHVRNGVLLGTRGILIDNNAKTLFILDGQQLNRRQHFGTMAGLQSYLLGDLDTIEVINGPGAIVHGSGAINGFINVIPKNGKDHPGLYTNLVYGFREKLALAEAGYGLDYGPDRNLYVYAGWYGADGFTAKDPHNVQEKIDDPTVNTDGVTGNMESAFQQDQGKNYRASCYWNHGPLNMNVFFDSLEYDVPSPTFPDYFYFQQTLAIRPKYTFKFSNLTSLDVLFSGELYDQGGRQSTETGDGSGSESHWEGKALLKTRQFDKHSLAAGVLYGQRKFYSAQRFFSQDTVDGYESTAGAWDEMGVFAEDVFALTDQLTLSAGLRYDIVAYGNFRGAQWHARTNEEYDLNQTTSHFSPRIAAAYELTDTSVIKASYQHSFRYPDASYFAWIRFWNNVIEDLGIDDHNELKPETMDSIELNFHHELLAKKLHLDLNLYYNEFRDQLTWHNMVEGEGILKDGTVTAVINNQGWFGSFSNVPGMLYTLGGELIAKWKILENLAYWVGAGYVSFDPDFVDSGVRYPEIQVKSGANVSLLEKDLKLDLAFVYYSGIDKKYFEDVREEYTKPRLLLDIAASYRICEYLKLKLSVKNVLMNTTPPLTFEMQRWQLEGSKGYSSIMSYLTLTATY